MMSDHPHAVFARRNTPSTMASAGATMTDRPLALIGHAGAQIVIVDVIVDVDVIDSRDRGRARARERHPDRDRSPSGGAIVLGAVSVRAQVDPESGTQSVAQRLRSSTGKITITVSFPCTCTATITGAITSTSTSTPTITSTITSTITVAPVLAVVWPSLEIGS